MTCGECGSKDLKKQSVKGRSFAYKNHSQVTVVEPLELTVCQKCENIIIRAGNGELIDEAIAITIDDSKSIFSQLDYELAKEVLDND